MDIAEIIPHIEALIFASDRPLSAPEITDFLDRALGFMEEKASLEQVVTAIEVISEKYDAPFYAFRMMKSGGGYQFFTKKEYFQTVAQLNGDKFLKRLSSAALETLAIIAYKQPITKGEIEHIRGVNSDYSIQKLLEKELVLISGRNEDLPGKPLIYTVSRSFMDYFGINSSADLPRIREVFPEEIVNPSEFIVPAAPTPREESGLAVGQDGALLIEGQLPDEPGESEENLPGPEPPYLSL